MCIESVNSGLPNSDGLCPEFISSENTEVLSQLKIILKNFEIILYWLRILRMLIEIMTLYAFLSSIYGS